MHDPTNKKSIKQTMQRGDVTKMAEKKAPDQFHGDNDSKRRRPISTVRNSETS